MCSFTVCLLYINSGIYIVCFCVSDIQDLVLDQERSPPSQPTMYLRTWCFVWFEVWMFSYVICIWTIDKTCYDRSGKTLVWRVSWIEWSLVKNQKKKRKYTQNVLAGVKRWQGLCWPTVLTGQIRCVFTQQTNPILLALIVQAAASDVLGPWGLHAPLTALFWIVPRREGMEINWGWGKEGSGGGHGFMGTHRAEMTPSCWPAL